MGKMNDDTPPHGNGVEDDVLDDEEEFYEIEDEDQFIETDDEMMEDDDDDGCADETNVNCIKFTRHEGSVFMCEISPSGDVAASGGEDDKAYVYDVTSGAMLFECTGHKDSVTNISFSRDGTYIATADIGGFIQVWKIATQNKVWEFETDDLNWIKWHFSANILFAGTGKGDIWMWLIPTGNTKCFSHSGESTDCGVLTPDGKRLCAGYANGTVNVLDLKSCQTICTIKCHDGPITTLSSHQDNALLLSGSVDGKAKLLCSNIGKEIATFSCELPDMGEENGEEYNNSVEAVSFSPSIADLAVTTTLSGMITIWNVSSKTSRHHIIQGCGTTCIAWHPSEPYFATAGLDGYLRIYDARSAQQTSELKGDGSGILNCQVNKDGSKLIMSTDNGSVVIYNAEDLWPK